MINASKGRLGPLCRYIRQQQPISNGGGTSVLTQLSNPNSTSINPTGTDQSWFILLLNCRVSDVILMMLLFLEDIPDLLGWGFSLLILTQTLLIVFSSQLLCWNQHL
jgi:hypothetical protein